MYASSDGMMPEGRPRKQYRSPGVGVADGADVAVAELVADGVGVKVGMLVADCAAVDVAVLVSIGVADKGGDPADAILAGLFSGLK